MVALEPRRVLSNSGRPNKQGWGTREVEPVEVVDDVVVVREHPVGPTAQDALHQRPSPLPPVARPVQRRHRPAAGGGVCAVQEYWYLG